MIVHNTFISLKRHTIHIGLRVGQNESLKIEEELGKPLETEITEKPYVKPVPGRILRGYNPTAVSNKNEGIDFYAPPGTLVKAVADGVVALISKPVGGLGKIVLIKHDQSVISIYGRIKDLQVLKGGRVVQGQEIGKVENSFLDNDNSGKHNYLHFELRKGTKSLDPVPLLQLLTFVDKGYDYLLIFL